LTRFVSRIVDVGRPTVWEAARLTSILLFEGNRMRTLLAVAVCSMLAFAAVGCQKDDTKHDHDKMMKSDSAAMKHETMATMDACPHCPGVQTAKADGTCPVCGMKVTGGGNAK
jgi:uncharacterized paraquat-inducible protein A